MTIPNFQAFMLPWLEVLKDGNIHPLEEIRDFIARKFQLPDDERKKLLPSGKQTYFNNRVAWAGTYFKESAFSREP